MLAEVAKKKKVKSHFCQAVKGISPRLGKTPTSGSLHFRLQALPKQPLLISPFAGELGFRRMGETKEIEAPNLARRSLPNKGTEHVVNPGLYQVHKPSSIPPLSLQSLRGIKPIIFDLVRKNKLTFGLPITVFSSHNLSQLLTYKGLQTLPPSRVLSLQVALIEDPTLTFQSCLPLNISNLLPP